MRPVSFSLCFTLAACLAGCGDDNLAPPEAPTELVATPVDDGVRITWADNSQDEEQFKVMRLDEVIDPEYDLIGMVEVDVTAFDDLALEAGRVYKYKVLASNENGDAASLPVTFNAP